MVTSHQFGGNWTEEKLRRLHKYLRAYMQIFDRNQWARRYTTYYVDAFAGTGNRVDQSGDATLSLFESDDIGDVERFYEGSARIALQLDPSFDNYIFVERKAEYAQQLANLQTEFPDQRIQIHTGDANDFLQSWCQEINWSNNRAVVFLDPYGMAVDWSTIEIIANTKAIDLWILLPIGQAINRLLTRGGLPPAAWEEKLTRFFGTDTWKDDFYRQSNQLSLFDIGSTVEKTADFESIRKFFIERLESVFEKVSPNSLVLRNSRNAPLFALYFAASNPRGASTAVNIANDILRG